MEVKIVNIKADKVYVNTTIGNFEGIWCSPFPQISKRYIVELDSDDVIVPDNIKLSNISDPSIESTDQMVNVIGFVEEIQEKIMILRLQKSIIMLELSSITDFTNYIGCYVLVKLSNIKMYDTGIY